MKRTTSIVFALAVIVWPLVAMMDGVAIGQIQGRVDFVKLGKIKVHQAATGNSRTFPPTAAGLDAAVDALAAGDTLETFGGTYTLTDDLEFDVANVTWRATNTDITRAGITVTVTADGVSFRGVKSHGQAVLGGTLGTSDSAEFFSATDCQFDGDAQTYGMQILLLSHFHTFTNCEFREGGTAACYVVQSNGGKWTNCEIQDSTGDGLYFDVDLNAPSSNGGVGAAGNTNIANGVYYDPDAEDKWTGPLITGCHIRNNGRFGVIFRWTHDPTFTGNSVERNDDGGVYFLSPIQCTVTANVFERNSGVAGEPTSTKAEIIMELGAGAGEFTASDFAITGNQIGQFMQGIIINGSSAGAVYSGHIASNQFGAGIGNGSTRTRTIWWQSWRAGHAAQITANDITGFGTEANFVGIHIEAPSASVVSGTECFICGNRIEVKDDGVLLTYIGGATVFGNHIRECTNGIRNTASTNTILRSNIISGSITNDLLSDGATPSYLALNNHGITDNVAVNDANKLATVTPSAFALTTLDDASADLTRSTLGNVITIQGGLGLQTTLTRSTNHYFAIPSSFASSTATTRRIYIPSACRVKKVYLSFVQSAGTAEDTPVKMVINGTTEYAIATVDLDATNVLCSNTGLDVALAAGDYINFKIEAPNYVTQPTNVQVSATVEALHTP
jgi:hypothetical protein